MLSFQSRKEAGLITGYIFSLVLGMILTFISAGGISLYNFGKVLGVWMLTALVFQIVLATRIDFIEKGIGYDRMTNWHAVNGKIIALLVISHPVVMFSPQIISGRFSAVTNFILGNPSALLGVTAVLLIFLQVGITLYWKSLDYEIWRKTHLIGYLVVALGFLHSLLLGTETSLPPRTLLGYWWLILGVVAVSASFYSLVYRRVWKPSKFVVENVEKETEDVTTVELKPVEKDIVQKPGQFAYVKFDSEKVPAEEHHFTISSSPEKEGVSFTVKDVGDFTSKIQDLEQGETALVEGPYGSFTNQDIGGPLTFIAGGIGITPLMSMIRAMEEGSNPHETSLIYGNCTEKDIVFRDELAENDWLDVEHVLSEEEREGFRYGFIDRKILKEHVIEDSEIFICGPEPMMESVKEILEGIGIEKSRIHTEEFSLRS